MAIQNLNRETRQPLQITDANQDYYYSSADHMLSYNESVEFCEGFGGKIYGKKLFAFQTNKQWFGADHVQAELEDIDFCKEYDFGSNKLKFTDCQEKRQFICQKNRNEVLDTVSGLNLLMVIIGSIAFTTLLVTLIVLCLRKPKDPTMKQLRLNNTINYNSNTSVSINTDMDIKVKDLA